MLSLAARYVRTGFPLTGSSFTPTHAFLATWEHVGAYEEVRRGAAPSGELNTFQAVLASDECDSYALFLYPANGLQFLELTPKNPTVSSCSFLLRWDSAKGKQMT